MHYLGILNVHPLINAKVNIKQDQSNATKKKTFFRQINIFKKPMSKAIAIMHQFPFTAF